MRTQDELLQDLFRREFSKLVAVISKILGLEHIDTAEDIVAETFLTATESWKEKGTPANPTAWLYVVAKQKLFYHFRRNKIFFDKIVPDLIGDQPNQYDLDDIVFSELSIKDSQLQMIFAICNPSIVSEAQIGLALRILCGFTIDEIAEAFLSNKETINKRLFRAKEKLRQEKVKLEIPSEHEIGNRLDNVLHVIYLLFNEGYYSTTCHQTLRKELCLEALRLGVILSEEKGFNIPKTNALIALMCFHASRFNAREGSNREMILYEFQDKNLWDAELIAQGTHYLNIAIAGTELSPYHLEAGIAFLNTQKEDTPAKWNNILFHYDLLMSVKYSSSVALNRLYALYKAKGKAAALSAMANFNFTHNHFYYTLLGELHSGEDNNKARANYEKALSQSRNEADRQVLEKKIRDLEGI